MIISRTPFRISFFGGGTDYPAWYKEHGGAVLATTIDKYCYLTCRFRPPFFGEKFRIVYSQTEVCQKIDEIHHPAVREVLRFLNIDRGLEIHHDGDLPAKSGIGSSSSFTVGLLNALYGLKGQMPNKHQLALESIYIEQEILKENVGSQDQALAAYGGFNHVTFQKNGEISFQPVTITSEKVSELNDHLMLFYTGIVRIASVVAKSYVENIHSRTKQLQIMHGMVDEALAILSSGKKVKLFGELLHEAWEMKRTLSKQVSNPVINKLYLEAKAAGAIGGKIIGAGGGGFLLLFVPPSRQAKLREKFKKLVYVPFRFETGGSQIIFFDKQEEYPLELEERFLIEPKTKRKKRKKTNGKDFSYE